jgi:hypothetical protein
MKEAKCQELNFDKTRRVKLTKTSTELNRDLDTNNGRANDLWHHEHKSDVTDAFCDFVPY